MTGIEKITGTIIDSANQTAQKIIDEAKNNAKEISLKAQNQAEISEQEILAKSMEKAESVSKAGDSACTLMRKNQILEAKMKMIDECFEKSVEKLKSLDDATYFSVIKNLVVANAVKGEGTLILNSNDLKRVPNGLLQGINDSLKSDRNVVLSEKPNDKIIGGCVLKYDEIEINCAFDAIINSEKERLIDSVNNALFN